MSGLHLLVVSVEMVRKGILQEAAAAIRKGTTNDGGKVILLFKVVGENRLVTVLDGGIEGAFLQVASSCGSDAQMDCTVLCKYEEFAKRILKLDDALLRYPEQHLGKDGQIYWVHVELNSDLSTTSLLDIWRREAVAILQTRQQGAAKLEFFKVVAAKEVHGFMEIKTNADCEEMTWNLPIIKEMGANVTLVFKSVTSI